MFGGDARVLDMAFKASRLWYGDTDRDHVAAVDE
jgi:hypothetical protein